MAHLLDQADTKMFADDVNDLLKKLSSERKYTVVEDDTLLEETYAVREKHSNTSEIAVPVWDQRHDAEQVSMNEGSDYGVMCLDRGHLNYLG